MNRTNRRANAAQGAGGMGRREFLRLGGGAAVAAAGPLTSWLAGAQAAVPAGPPGTKPSFILIFADDQGYQDIGCFGSPDIKTPNLDRMAAEGLRLTDFYVASPVCTPSRTALLTGCYPRRVGLEKGVLFPASKIGLNPNEVTIAEVLKGQGYATMCIGKWHLGYQKQFLPTRQGFDGYYGIPYSNDMSLAPGMDYAAGCKLGEGLTVEDLKAGQKKGGTVPLMRDEQVIEYPVDQTTLTEKYTAEALKFIEANKDRPFFLYLPHNMPHVPLHISERFKGKSARGLYGDVIECIDWSVGEILAALKKYGIDERTMVIYTSDNGPWLTMGKNGGSALPLRDGKGTPWEGGMREPCIIRWPGRVPAGKVCSEMALSMDLMPTLAGLAGTRPPADRVIDGKDIWPLLSGQEGAKTPHEAFFYHTSGGQLAAVRSGKWKLHIRPQRRAAPAKAKAGKNKAAKDQPATAKAEPPPAMELYDLAADIGEKTNVADQHPDVVARLKALADDFEKEITAHRRPVGMATT